MATSGNISTPTSHVSGSSGSADIGLRFYWEVSKTNGIIDTISYYVRAYGTGYEKCFIYLDAKLNITDRSDGENDIAVETQSRKAYTNESKEYSGGTFSTSAKNIFSGSFNITHGASTSFSVELILVKPGYETTNKSSGKKSITLNTYGSPSITGITDNGNNTITVSFKPGTNLSGSTCTIKLKCGSNTAYSISKNKGDGSFNVSLNDIAGMSSVAASALACTISQANGTGTISSNYTSGSIKYYKEPSAPSKTGITVTCNKNKYVPTAIFTFRWQRPAAGNDSSPVRGYSIRVYKNGTAMATPANGTSNYLDRDGADTLTYSVSAEDYNMTVGDSLQIGLWAYTKNGKNAKLYSSETKSNAIVIVADKNYTAWARETPTSPWKKCEVMHAKISGTFKEVSNIHKLK